MIEILQIFTVNCKMTEVINEGIKVVDNKKQLNDYRKELKEKHGKDIIFTFREK